MGAIAQFIPRDPEPLTQSSGLSYVSDNGEINGTFTRDSDGNNVVQFSNVSTGAMVSWYPKEIKYTDVENQIDDILYSADNTSDLFVVRQFHARYDRHFPDVEEYWRVEAGQLKHFVTLTGDQRDPMPFLTNPKLAVGGMITFDPSFTVQSMGMTITGDFQTESGINIVDANGNAAFTLPAIEAWDQAGNKTGGSYIVTDMAPGQIYVAMAVPFSWLNQDTIVYPVVIDPTTVVASTYTTCVTARPQVMTNGSIAVVVNDYTNSYFRVFSSSDNGNTWSQAASIYLNVAGTVSFATAAYGNVLYILMMGTSGATLAITSYDFGSGTVGNTVTISNSMNFYKGCSLVADSSGNLYATWSGYIPNYTGCANIQYGKSTDGGRTWAIQNVTLNNSGGLDSYYPIILLVNGAPIILCIASSGPLIQSHYFNGTSWLATNVFNNGYTIGSIDAVVDGNGTVHLAWFCASSTYSGYNNVMYAKSTNPTGNAFGTAIYLTKQASGGTYQNPSVSKDANNTIYVFFAGDDNNTSKYVQIGYVKSTDSGSTWSSISVVSTNTTNNATIPATNGYTHGVNCVYQDTQTSSVEFYQLLENNAPNAPSLTPVSNFDATTETTFTWQFSDPDSGDTQSAYQLQIVDVAANTTAVDTGKVASTTTSYTLPANTLTNGKQYQWRVMTWDELGAQGPYSQYSTFNTAGAPTVTITSPTASYTDPVSNITVEWSYSDPNDYAQASYEVQLLDTNNTIVWDSGVVNDASGNTRSMTVGYTLANNSNYTLKLTVADSQGIASAPSSVTFSVSYTAPPQSQTTATPINTNASIVIDIINPDPTGTQPSVTSNDIFRRNSGTTAWTRIAKGIAPNGLYTDYAVASGQSYDYKITVYGNNGTQIDSPVVSASTSFSGVWLHDPLDAEGTTHRFRLMEQGRTMQTQFTQTMMQFEGRSLPVADIADQETEQIQVTIDCLKENNDLDALYSLISAQNTLLYRDGRGRKVYGVVAAIPETEQQWGSQIQLTVNAVDYQEAI